MPFANLRLEKRPPLAVVTVDRPKVLNALNAETIGELRAAFDELAADDGVRVILLTGAGDRAFVAGADIRELAALVPGEAQGLAERGQAVFRRIETLGKPVIACVQGFALGGGCELAMACTMRIATEDAKLGQPEAKLGLLPGYGGTQRLPRLVGEARATELVMSGRTIDAAQAERWGLVNRLVEDGDPVELGKTFMSEFIGYSRCASLFAREAVVRGCATTLDEGLDIEADLSTLAYQTADAAEGMRAFVEKRTPEFRDA
jgi:enoyl-CoA hydratase